MDAHASGLHSPVLLTMPSFDGTLAAARCLGQKGIPVTLAGTADLSPSRWSRHVRNWVAAPSVFEPERYLEWLLEFGAKEPGYVLYPTSDDLAWLFAEHADELGRYYQLYQPKVASIIALLDKKALHELCSTLAIPTPRTVYPRSVAEAARLAADLEFPLLIKPRTQMLLPTRNKGMLVESRASLRTEYERFVRKNRPHPRIREVISDVDLPMVQEFQPDAAGATYSISGFITRDGRVTARSAVKVLQRPRRVGVGICFEDAEIDATALNNVIRLCEHVGYHGIFEVEFVRRGDSLMLIDFNPRFFGQMGFDIVRGLPLPYLAWLGATSQNERLHREVTRANAWETEGYVYCNRFYFGLAVYLRALTGRMSAEERARWQCWLEDPSRRELAFDPMSFPEDPWPNWVSKLRELYSAARHPRAFIRNIVLSATGLALDAMELGNTIAPLL